MKQGEQAREHLGRWASPEDEQRYRALEDELWREAFPTPPERLTVETDVGPPAVYPWPGAGAPIVFVPRDPLPTSFAPCCVQVVPLRVKTQAAPTNPLSPGPPTIAVVPSAESATADP